MMKRLIVACCVGMGILFGTVLASAEIVDKIMAILDEELILLSEVREIAAKPVNRIVANLESSPDVDKDALQYVIERRLLQQEIQYLAFPKEKDLVLALVTEYISASYHNNNMQSFEQQLQAQGITKAQLEEELELYMKGIDYIRRKFRFDADVNDPAKVLELFQSWIKDIKAHTEIHTLGSQTE